MKLSIAVIVLSVIYLAQPSAAFYERGTEVINIRTSSDLAKIEKSKFLWIIELYREGCGYCQQLTPEYEKAAKKLEKMVRVAAVDVEKFRDVAGQLQNKYNFQVKGVPTIIMLKPKSKKTTAKERIDYNGQRTARDISKYAVSLMPDFSQRVTAASYNMFEAIEGFPKALFFSEKAGTPALVKALSTKYSDRMKIGLVDKNDRVLAKMFEVTEYPAVFVIKQGEHVEETKPIRHTGKIGFMPLDFFLMDYALPKTKSGSSSSSSSSSKKADKAKAKGSTTGGKSSTSKNKEPEERIKIKDSDLEKFSVKQMRSILKRWDDTCKGCAEKADFVARISELRAKLGDRDSDDDDKNSKSDTSSKAKNSSKKEEIVDNDADVELCTAPSGPTQSEYDEALEKIKSLEEENKKLKEALSAFKHTEL